MKNIKIYLIIFTAFLISCNDDSLERYPITSVSNQTFWNNETDLEVYNNGFYQYARSTSMRLLVGHGTGYDGQCSYDAMSDNNARTLQFHESFVKIRAGQHNPDDNPYSFGWNNTCFQFVRAINIGLANYDKADVSESIIENYKAEARLFRAWVVADKVSLYGDYPWIDKELNIDSEELFEPRTPRETVMANVLSDLDFACDYLPDDWGDGNAPGRLNRWAALHIKSRICLFEGTWRKYHGGNDADTWLQAAADAAKELIDDGPYSLYSTGNPDHDYNAIFQMYPDLTGVDEVIYWRRYMTGVRPNSWNISYRWHNATKSAVEDYLCTDGLPITLSPLYQGDEVFENLFENRDPRLRQTILHPDDVESYNYGNHEENGLVIPVLPGMSLLGGYGVATKTGYHQIKFYDYGQAILSHDGNLPCVILRFGETLLNYAEAKAELGTLSQSDLDISINKLRDRVGMPHMDINNIPVDPRYTADGVSPLIVEIRRERRVELFSEGFRYDDLRRWKQGAKLRKKDYGIRWDEANRNRIDPAGETTELYEEVDGKNYICPHKGTVVENPVFEEPKHYLWPIPVSARSKILL